MDIIVIAHNIRSTHNVGAILRTGEGFGIHIFWVTGYTPYPTIPDDTRLPHIRNKLTRQISKTALGAEKLIQINYADDIIVLLTQLKAQGFTIAALEQAEGSISLNEYHPPEKLALLLGEEVHGVAPELLTLCDVKLEIPMKGRKESFNVSVATGIVLYGLTTASNAK